MVGKSLLGVLRNEKRCFWPLFLPNNLPITIFIIAVARWRGTKPAEKAYCVAAFVDDVLRSVKGLIAVFEPEMVFAVDLHFFYREKVRVLRRAWFVEGFYTGGNDLGFGIVVGIARDEESQQEKVENVVFHKLKIFYGKTVPEM